MNEPVRIAMWSGPRNISTAMMRAFEARGDTCVVDEPFYAAYLHQTGLEHPMRHEVLASQPTDWRAVVEQLFAPIPPNCQIQYAKHMTHHMLPSIRRDWIAKCRSGFLIREPSAVLASYARKRTATSLADLGYVPQLEIFREVADRLGHAPPVIDGSDVLAAPGSMLSQLCAALDIPYSDAMLRWPPGRRASDGVWAPAWYDAVERSTGFAPVVAPATPQLPAELERIADAAQPYYDALATHRLRPAA